MAPQTPQRPAQRFNLNRRHAIAGAAAWLNVLIQPSARAQTPDPIDAIWQDATRSRALPVRLRWPAPQTPVPDGGWPVIVYSHGLGGTAGGASVWGQAWAQAGFVVVHVQHPGSDLNALQAAARTGLGRMALREASSATQLVVRLQDVVFTLNQIAQEKLLTKRWANVRANAVGIAGHSFGAHTTLGMGGQAYAGRSGMQDSRVGALIALSPIVPRTGDSRLAFANITRPTLCITGTLDGDVIGTGATPEQRAAVFDALPAGQKAMLLLKGANHTTFSGTEGRAASWPQPEGIANQLNQQHRAVVAQITTDWWRAHLLGDTAAAARLITPAGLETTDVWRTG